MRERDGVVRLLAHRRAYQASTRVLGELDSAVAALRSRTGDRSDPLAAESPDWGSAGEDLDLAVHEATATAAYQMSRRATAAIRQLSLAEFLR